MGSRSPRRSAFGMCTRSSISTGALHDSFRDIPRWRRATSAIWSPTVNAGFRLRIACWNTMLIRCPRIACSSLRLSVMRSTPSSFTDPVGVRPSSSGIKPITASDVTVLPEPVSPTRPRVCPASTENEASCTTRSQPPRERNSTVSPSTSSAGGGTAAGSVSGSVLGTVLVSISIDLGFGLTAARAVRRARWRRRARRRPPRTRAP